MRLGIGIDTGGTCTDAVVYDFSRKEILACGKTPTTKMDLSIGIGNALDQLPNDLLGQAEIIALSTTLATNACVENKGGRAKLIFFGLKPGNIDRVGNDYGLPMDDNLIFIDSQTRPTGEIVREPDWDDFRNQVHGWLDECDAVGVVELFANKSGAQLEKTARDIIVQSCAIPVVCGHELFSESNIVKRGASALLNARLISVIEQFLQAVKKALAERNINAPFVIVRSDGSLMTGEFTATRPVETLLCGPVASVMGATELTQEENCIVVDIGGTTTDVAFVKNSRPQRVTSGIRIGKWSTFVKGLFVDTFGLGGDSGVVINPDHQLMLEGEKVMPLCMAAEKYPSLLQHLKRSADNPSRSISPQRNIYVRCRDIGTAANYTAQEQQIAALLEKPHSLEELKDLCGEVILPGRLSRLLSEGILIRCGVTPTDAMHVRGDFTQYSIEASQYGMRVMARALGISVEDLAGQIYHIFKRKLYCNLVRILVEDTYPSMRAEGLGEHLEQLIAGTYTGEFESSGANFLTMHVSTPAVLVGVGAPTKLFLDDVGHLLGTKVVLSKYSPVANALGAVVGKVSASVAMEVNYQVDMDAYVVSGCGQRLVLDQREEAEETAREIAKERAREEIIARGADPDTVEVSLDTDENIFETEFGPVYMGYQVSATASGNMQLPEGNHS